MTEAAEPFAAFYDTPTFLPPGEFARWQREEAAIRAEEQRKEAERADRADARYEAAVWEARQHAVGRGLAWDPNRPFEHRPSIEVRADAAFAYQDAQARRADLAAAKEAGLVHLVHQGPPHPPGSMAAGEPSPLPTEPGLGPAGAAARTGVLSMRDPRTDTSPSGKARLALRRWAGRDRRNRAEQENQR
jgi:hypothetical protein